MWKPQNVVHRPRATSCFVGSNKASVLHKMGAYRRQQQTPQQQQTIAARLREARQQDYANCDTFHRAVKPFLLIAHLFGIMPLVNTNNSNPYRLKFRVQSMPMIFTAIFLICGGLKTTHLTANFLSSDINAKKIVTIVFFYVNYITCLHFLSLAKQWPQLIQQWTRIELIFMLPPYKHNGDSLQRQIKYVAIFFFTAALFDHGLYYASSYYNYRMQIIQCTPNKTDIFVDFLMDEYKDVFTYLPYNICLIFYSCFLNCTFTFIWNFMDLFIMLVSLGMAMRFQQLAKRCDALAEHYVPEVVWYDARQHHTHLCELMERVDELLSPIVLISSLNNMYFICIQLLNIFTKLRWPINYIYFWYSLIFLILRAASVFMCAGKIHDASILPLKALYLVPSECWSEEVQRFTAQITNESIGLTGKRFYIVTRKSLFGLIATIVTYEFMLLQFDANNRGMALPDLCG